MTWNGDAVVRSMRAKADRGTAAVATALATSLTQTLSAPGGGKPAPRGQPPNRQTGRLMGAVGVQRGRDGSVLVGILDNSQRAKAQALARTRPFVAPAVRRSRARLLGEFKKGAK